MIKIGIHFCVSLIRIWVSLISNTFTERPEKETGDVRQTVDMRQTGDMRQTKDARQDI